MRRYYFTTRFEGSIFRRRQVRLVRFELNILKSTNLRRPHARLEPPASRRVSRPDAGPETRRGSSSSNVTPRPRDHRLAARLATVARRASAHTSRATSSSACSSSRASSASAALASASRARGSTVRAAASTSSPRRRRRREVVDGRLVGRRRVRFGRRRCAVRHLRWFRRRRARGARGG